MGAVRRPRIVPLRETDPWLADRLQLTAVGRIAVIAVLLLGAVAGFAGSILAFVDVKTRDVPEVILGFEFAFAWLAVVACTVVLLAAVIALDTAFRALRWSFRRVADVQRISPPS
jgi:hypothetical protein